MNVIAVDGTPYTYDVDTRDYEIARHVAELSAGGVHETCGTRRVGEKSIHYVMVCRANEGVATCA